MFSFLSLAFRFLLWKFTIVTSFFNHEIFSPRCVKKRELSVSARPQVSVMEALAGLGEGVVHLSARV